MLFNTIISLKNKYKKWFLLSFLIFMLMSHYGILSTCADSLFLQHYKINKLPHLWLYIAIITIILNSTYNKFNNVFKIIKLLFLGFCFTALSVFFILLAYQSGFKLAIFILGIWKESYFVLLVEIFWSFAALISSNESAKKNFGIMMGIGTLGSCLSYFAAGIFATKIGTIWTAWITVPILLLCSIVTWFISREYPDEVYQNPTKHKIKAATSFNVLYNSSYLLPLLALMLVAKICITFIDFEFNSYLQSTFPDVDYRTKMNGDIRASISGIAIFLQLVFGTLVRKLGIKTIFLSVPIFMALAVGLFLVIPGFNIVLTRIINKSFDYSLFKLCRQMLYMPLSRAEKTKGKAFIDIVMFRLSKGLCSFIIIVLLSMGFRNYIPHVILALQVVWLLLSYEIIQRYYNVVNRDVTLTPVVLKD